MGLYAEIQEQPEVLANLLSRNVEIVAVAHEISKIKPKFVFLAARGTSDNAGRYSQYLWGAYNGIPIALATPSLFSHYKRAPRLDEALVAAISQSGRSPDILSVVKEGKHQMRPVLVISNAPDSPIANEADLLIDINTGPEKAVAATKTYTAELLALAMLSVEIDKDTIRREELKRLPEWAQIVLNLDREIARMVERYRYMEHCVVIGRGYNYATAFEWSLKLKELTYVVAQPYSSADFLHGPIALVDRGFPVFVIAPGGEIFPSLLEVVQKAYKKGAELVIVSNKNEILELAHSPIPLPNDIPEWLSPILAILPAQLFSYHLARARGLDVETPRGLSKVTKTL